MWINRHIEKLLVQRAATRPALLLTGARQTGKTSLMRKLFPDHHYVCLNLPSLAEQADRDPGSFLERHNQPVIIDEVQNAPGLFRYLKIAIDRDRQNGSFLLIGSQKFNRMHTVSDSLVGRVDILELEPLTFAEVKAVYADLTIEDFLVRGGFPELYLDLKLDAQGFMQSYLATFLERDLRQLLEVANLGDYERFIRASALRSSQLLNQADISRDVGIAGSTLAAWLAVLEASHQVIRLEPWFGTPTVFPVKSPKLFFRDAGLAAFLCGVHSVEDLRISPLVGALWETLVCAEIRRSQINRRGGWHLNFWRDRSREADFLIHRGGRFHLADAKWTERPRSRDASALKKVERVLSDSLVESLSVVCRTPNAYPLTEDVAAVPLNEMNPAFLGN